MAYLINVVVFCLPYLIRFLRVMFVSYRGVMLIPFVVGMVASFGTMYAYWHEVNVGVNVAMESFQTTLQSISVGQSDALCWVSAFGVFTALRIVVQAAIAALTMLVTQFIAMQTLLLSNHLLEIAVQAVH